MRKALKKERTKQVQFRMPEDLHFELRMELLKNGKSMADLFNETAKRYINKGKKKSSMEDNE